MKYYRAKWNDEEKKIAKEEIQKQELPGPDEILIVYDDTTKKYIFTFGENMEYLQGKYGIYKNIENEQQRLMGTLAKLNANFYYFKSEGLREKYGLKVKKVKKELKEQYEAEKQQMQGQIDKLQNEARLQGAKKEVYERSNKNAQVLLTRQEQEAEAQKQQMQEQIDKLNEQVKKLQEQIDKENKAKADTLKRHKEEREEHEREKQGLWDYQGELQEELGIEREKVRKLTDENERLNKEVNELKQPKHRTGNYKGRQPKWHGYEQEWYKKSQSGMTYKEIAKQYGCSEDTVCTRLVNAGLNKRRK